MPLNGFFANQKTKSQVIDDFTKTSTIGMAYMSKRQQLPSG